MANAIPANSPQAKGTNKDVDTNPAIPGVQRPAPQGPLEGTNKDKATDNPENTNPMGAGVPAKMTVTDTIDANDPDAVKKASKKYDMWPNDMVDVEPGQTYMLPSGNLITQSAD